MQKMTQEQKATLQDCFEGCMPFKYAVEIVADSNVAADAMATWARWTREIEEEGFYIY